MRYAVLSRIALIAFLAALLVPAVALSRNVHAALGARPAPSAAALYPHAMTAEEGDGATAPDEGCPYLRGEAGTEGRGCPYLRGEAGGGDAEGRGCPYLERRHAAPAPEPEESEGGTGCPYLNGGGEASRVALMNRV